LQGSGEYRRTSPGRLTAHLGVYKPQIKMPLSLN
jgi:hypothetical protein